MKIAVGIIGLVLSMMALLQSCTLTGISGISGDTSIQQASSLGMLAAILMFFGGAFSFGLPKVARVVFVLSFLASIPARKAFPDMWVWGFASLFLSLLLLFVTTRQSPKLNATGGDSQVVDPGIGQAKRSLGYSPIGFMSPNSTQAEKVDNFGIESLEKLASLRDSGLLTDEEFTSAKKRVLDKL